MKYYITDKNMKSTTGVRDIPYFKTEIERNNWIKDNLLDGKTIDECLETSNEYSTQILNMVNTSIEVPYDSAMVNKNYVIVDDNIYDGYLFYIIKDMDMDGNSNMVTLTLELDVLMTYFEWIDNVSNFELTQGHTNFMNYFDYEFNGGKRTVNRIDVVKRMAANEGDDISSTVANRYDISMVVYRQLKSGEEPAIINGLESPYKIFIAPYPSDLDIIVGSTVKKITARNLVKYYHKLADDQTYKIHPINHNFFTANNITGTQFKLTNGSASHFNSDGVDLLELKSYTFSPNVESSSAYKRNTFEFTIDVDTVNTNHFDYLTGLESEKIMVYGQKEIDWPFNRVKPIDGKVRLHIGAFLAPNENKQFYKWNDEMYIQDNDNTWDNDAELTVFKNQLSSYKASNPVSSKMDYLKPLASLANPLNFINPAAGLAAVAQAGVQVVGTATNRMNMKKSPESVKGDTNTYFITANAPKSAPVGFDSGSKQYNVGYLTVKVKYTYIGNDRDSIINSLYKYGATYESPIYVSDYSEIKRPRFNFMRIDSISNANFNMELPDNVLIELERVVSNGVRLWNDDYLEYDARYNYNGDMIENG